MKKNALLFFILISLLTFTYFFQEKGLWSKKLKSQTTLLELGELDSIILKDGTISLKPTPIIDNLKFPADAIALDRFLKMLQSIVVRKEIPFDEKSYKNYFSPDALRIKFRRRNLAEMEFILGEMVPGTEDFYWLEKQENVSKLFVASFEETLKKGESQYYNSGDKYKHLSQMLELSSETFFSSSIISTDDLNHLTSIKFVPKDFPPFEIPFSLDERKKLKPDFSLSWNIERIEILKQGLANLKATGVVRKIENVQVVLEVILSTLNSQKIQLRILRSNDSNPSYFIEKDNSQLWFTVGVGIQDLFLVPKEDFWIKKLPFENKKLKDVEITLKQLKKSRTLISSMNPSTSLRLLFDLVFARSPWAQADRISPLTKNDPIFLLKPLELTVEGLNLFLTQKNDEIILINKTDGYVLHYYLTNERANHKIKFNLEEYN